jgi:ankyrin repeat protein
LDLNFIDDSVGSLLHYAVVLSSFNTSQETHQTLHQVVAYNSSGSKRMRTPNEPNSFCLNDETQVIEILIESGAEINSINKLGQTPLHICKDLRTARLLLHNGAIMNTCEITGKTPLFTFICRANYDICVEMLKNGCTIENIDKLGNTILFAILHNNAPIRIILLLLEAGYPLNKEEWQKLVSKYPKLVKLIERKMRNPASLKELARKALRLHLNKINNNKSILNSVNKLKEHLPSSLQDYMLLNIKSDKNTFLYK